MSAPDRTYVEYGALATAPGPLSCSGARLWAFWLEGDLDAIAGLCRSVFDGPSGGAVSARPLLPYVALSFGEIDRIVAGGDYARRGNVTERQVGLWVPVLVLKRAGRGPWWRLPKLPVPYMLAAFIPYMWLDNPLSVASGREVYGYPKTWGWATFPGERPRGLCEGEPSTTFQLDVYGLRTHSPETKAGRERLLEVTPVPDGGEFEPESYDGIGDLLAATARELGDPAAASVVPESVKASLRGPNPTINQLFLKQFRAAGEGALASQQQIVRAGAKPAPGGESKSMPPHRIEIAELASHPLGRELGLSGTPRVRMPSSVEMDFTVDVGSVVWDSAG